MISAAVVVLSLFGACHDRCSQHQAQCQAQCGGVENCTRHCGDQAQDCHRLCDPPGKEVQAPPNKFQCGLTANKKPKYCTQEEMEKEAERMQKQANSKLPAAQREKAIEATQRELKGGQQ